MSKRLEDSSKVVYASDQEKIIEEAFNTYLKAKIVATDNKIPLGPVDNK
jgi:hypothetical protein